MWIISTIFLDDRSDVSDLLAGANAVLNPGKWNFFLPVLWIRILIFVSFGVNWIQIRVVPDTDLA